MNGNGKLFFEGRKQGEWRKGKNCIIIKVGNGRLALKQVEVGKIWKDYFEDLYNIDTQEQAEVQICGFDGVDEARRGNYFGGKVIRRT